jgi:hypothetical protein
MSTTAKKDARMLYAREVDRLYRLRHGTAAEAWKNGTLRGKMRGTRLCVSAKRAQEIWGEG